MTDLVKNHFTKHLRTKSSVDAAVIQWKDMIETIRNSSTELSTDDFIYHFWGSRYEAVSMKKLFPKIKSQITKTKAKEYLGYLVSDSILYRSIHEPSYGWDKNEVEVSRSLSAIQLFKLSQPTPAILSLVRAYRIGIIKYGKLRDTVSAIEKFHFVFTAITSSRSSGGISAMYASFAKRLFESSEPNSASSAIQDFINKLQTKKPSLDEFRVAFGEVQFTNTNSKQKGLVRYILRKLSEYYQFKYPCDFDDLTIEHIFPQDKINEGEWKENVVGSIGNLIYLDQKMNEKLGTKSFLDKKDILVQGNYQLPDFVNGKTDWQPQDVIAHTNHIAELAYNKIWKI